MHNPPATIYALSHNHNVEELSDKLDGYRNTREVEEITDPLITTIESLTKTDRGLGFSIDHDYVQAINQRDREGPYHVKATQTVYGRFCKNIGSDGFMLIGSDHSVARGAITKAIEGDSEASTRLSFPTNAIGRIVSMDSVGARYKIWDDIDMFTHMASIKGKIQDSTHAQDFDEHGRPVWVMFDSQFLGKTVGVSQKGFVIYGNEVDSADVEEYYFEVIREAMDR